MTASEIRQEARKCLTGKWGKGALATLIFGVITYIISFVLNLVPMVGSIAASIISIPLSFGFTVVMMCKLKRNEDFSYLDFFKAGFDKFVKVWQTTLWIFVKMLAPIVVAIIGAVIMASGISMSAAGSSGSVLIILGIIVYLVGIIWTIPRAYSYRLALYIVNDNPNMLAKEAVEKSAEIMNGHRWAYFWLQCTFIGWAILACFTLGIGMFWLFPYMYVSTVAFYDNLIGNKKDESDTDETVAENPIQEN